MDAGVAPEKNVAWLRDSGYRYRVVSRERTRRFDPDLAIALKTRSRQSVHVHKVADVAETRLYCYSEARANKERRIAERFAAAPAAQFDTGDNSQRQGPVLKADPPVFRASATWRPAPPE